MAVRDVLSGISLEEIGIRERKRASASSCAAFAFDIDGVLLRSNTILPGASETLQHLANIGVPFIFLTNSGGAHESKRIENLSQQLSVPLLEDQFVQSHTPIRAMVERYRNENVLIIGGVGNACREVAEMYGFQSVITSADIITQYPKYWPFNQIGEEYYQSFAKPLPAPINPADPENSLKISAIFVFNSSRDWGLDAQLCLDLLISDRGILGTESPLNGRSDLPNNGWQGGGQPMICFANPDFVWATNWDHGPRFGQAAWILALEAIFAEHTNYTGRLQSHKIGKPHATNFHWGEAVLIRKRNAMCRELGITVEEAGHLTHIFMIGDNPKSDIEGTNSFESCNNVLWFSILVQTGVWKQGQPNGFPQWIVPDVKAAVNGVLRMKNLPTMPE